MRRDRELRGRDACSHTAGAAEAHCGGLCPRRGPSHSYPTTRIVGFSPNPIQRNGRKRFSPLATRAWWQAALLQPWPPAACRRAAGLASLALDRLRKTA